MRTDSIVSVVPDVVVGACCRADHAAVMVFGWCRQYVHKRVRILLGLVLPVAVVLPQLVHRMHTHWSGWVLPLPRPGPRALVPATPTAPCPVLPRCHTPPPPGGRWGIGSQTRDNAA
jgi:hypothetical protein